ncbi:Plant self-incompatibility protein S1 family [Raphanus sativus]|nr:Plant self-incompatibility protein S1 family [Raphanus sativus]
MKTLIIWCLVSQAIILAGNSAAGVDFSILIKNGMYNFKKPAVFYHCRSSKKDLGWHKSLPSSEFRWSFQVPKFGIGVMIHNCEFRSRLGTANIEIETLSTTAILCGGHKCKYAIRRNGIYFIGYELYYPFGGIVELSRPVEKLIEPWTPWSPHQLRDLNRSKQNHS